MTDIAGRNILTPEQVATIRDDECLRTVEDERHIEALCASHEALRAAIQALEVEAAMLRYLAALVKADAR